MGYYAFGDKLPEKQKLEKMFILLKSRGKDASGFAYIKNGNLMVVKDAVIPEELIKNEEWTKLELPKIMIFHTRARTQGSEKNSNNNHPLYNKEGVAIVHNGIIFNDNKIIPKQHRDGEVDSEAILYVLANGKGNRIKRVFNKIYGSFAVAAIDKRKPEELILMKNDNPLDMCYDTINDIFYFCSRQEMIKEALEVESSSKRGFNLGSVGYHYYEMDDDYGMIINQDGIESYEKYKGKGYSSYDSYGAFGSLSQCTNRHSHSKISLEIEKYNDDMERKGFIIDEDSYAYVSVDCPYCGVAMEVDGTEVANVYCINCDRVVFMSDIDFDTMYIEGFVPSEEKLFVSNINPKNEMIF